MQTDQNFTASTLHIARRPLVEFDVELTNGVEFTRANLTSAIAAAGGSENFEALTCQCYKAEADGEFVAKFALALSYDLSANGGEKLTPLSRIFIHRIEAKNLRFIAEEAGVTLHFVIYA